MFTNIHTKCCPDFCHTIQQFNHKLKKRIFPRLLKPLSLQGQMLVCSTTMFFSECFILVLDIVMEPVKLLFSESDTVKVGELFPLMSMPSDCVKHMYSCIWGNNGAKAC